MRNPPDSAAARAPRRARSRARPRCWRAGRRRSPLLRPRSTSRPSGSSSSYSPSSSVDGPTTATGTERRRSAPRSPWRRARDRGSTTLPSRPSALLAGADRVGIVPARPAAAGRVLRTEILTSPTSSPSDWASRTPCLHVLAQRRASRVSHEAADRTRAPSAARARAGRRSGASGCGLDEPPLRLRRARPSRSTFA